MGDVIIDGESLTIADVVRVAEGTAKVILAPEAVPKVMRARGYIERLLADSAVVYGVTTGFGKFAEVPVAREDSLALQRNLVLSHCCGVGDPLGPRGDPSDDVASGERPCKRVFRRAARPCSRLCSRL